MTDDVTTDEVMKRVAIELLGITPDRYDAALNALCKRLGIARSSPELATWVCIGIELGREQPEFKPRKGPGRRPLKAGEGGRDYERARAIKGLRREKEAQGDKRRYTDRQLIEELSDHGHPLFPRTSHLEVLAPSVARGNKLWKKAMDELERLQGQLKQEEKKAATRKRQAARERKKKRTKYAKERASDPKSGLLARDYWRSIAADELE